MEFEIIRSLLSEQFSCAEEDITPATSLSEDLWADEMDYMELGFILEEEFDLSGVDPEYICQLDTVGAIADFAARRGK